MLLESRRCTGWFETRRRAVFDVGAIFRFGGERGVSSAPATFRRLEDALNVAAFVVHQRLLAFHMLSLFDF